MIWIGCATEWIAKGFRAVAVHKVANAVGWRGVGIDPGWVVEIVEAGGIIFVTGEGRRYEYPGPPDYEGESGAYVFRSAEAEGRPTSL